MTWPTTLRRFRSVWVGCQSMKNTKIREMPKINKNKIFRFKQVYIIKKFLLIWQKRTVKFTINEGQFCGNLQVIYAGNSSRSSLVFLPLLLRFRSLLTGSLDLRSFHHFLLQYRKSFTLFLTSVELLRHQRALPHRVELLTFAVTAIHRLYQHRAARNVEESSACQEASRISARETVTTNRFPNRESNSHI